MTLTECKRALEQLGVQPSKALGQNFLVDANILRIILEAAEVQPGEKVIEVGAGLGVLTAALLERGAQVTAIERDGKLIDFLRQRFAHRKQLEIIRADALKLDLKLSTADSKVVSNLPYSISSAIVKQFVEALRPPKKMVLMLQREVCERLAARPGTEDYGLLTVFAQVKYAVTLRHIVTRRCFYPAPDVDSAIVVMDRAPHPLLAKVDRTLFGELVHIGFGQRRKQFAKLLRQAGFEPERIDSALAKLGLTRDVRAESLSAEQFLKLSRGLEHGRNP